MIFSGFSLEQSKLCTGCVCLCGSLAQCVLSLKRLSAGPGFNPQTRQNKLFQDYYSVHALRLISRTGKRV